MEQEYLIDSNAVIDFLDNKLPQNANNLIENISCKISVISRIELLSWPNGNQNQWEILQLFVDASFVYQLTEPVIIKTIEIRKSFKIKLPDAIIAATALTNNLTLITRNVKDFENISGLKIINPWEY